MLTPVTAAKARSIFGCGERDDEPELTLTIGLPMYAQETVNFVCEDDGLDWSVRNVRNR